MGLYTQATQVLEQTLGRIIVAGRNADGNATLWAFTNNGQADVTFNSNETPGMYSTGLAHIIFAVVADQYDRLIYGLLGDGVVNITRLTSSGQVDTTFGFEGTISGVIANPESATQIRLALDTDYNIIVAANTTDGIVVVGYDQNSQIVRTSFTIDGLQYPVLTGMIATSEDKIL